MAFSSTSEQKVVVITGGAQGLGHSLVKASLDHGWNVAVFDIQSPEQGVASTHSFAYYQVDITSDEQVKDALAKVYAAFGRIDSLVNAAALFTALEHKEFTEISAEEWNKVFAVNVLGPFLLSKHVAPYLKTVESGSIVNFASNVVSFGMKNFMHYVSSKAAVVGMTRSLARELGEAGIRVNAVSPGFVTTEITERERDPEYRAALVSRQSIPEPILPEDICSTVLFLMSSESRAITGQTILVNGGSHMGPA